MKQKKLKTKIIVISGQQGSGKTSLSNELYKQLYNYNIQTFKFAGVLYSIHDYALSLLRYHGINISADKKDGKLLQLLGTDWGRAEYGDDVWVNVLYIIVTRFIKSSPHAIAIIDDCRFPNELAAFPNALKIRLEASRSVRKHRCPAWRSNERHKSETALNGRLKEFDRVYNTEKLSTADVAADVIRLIT